MNLEALVAARLARTNEKSTLYEVAHPAISRALLESGKPLVRAQLHRRAAEALEAETSDRRREAAGVLSRHWAASRAVPGHERGVTDHRFEGRLQATVGLGRRGVLP